MGLQDWVMSPDRTGLLGMNKEGIVSLSGGSHYYLALHNSFGIFVADQI